MAGLALPNAPDTPWSPTYRNGRLGTEQITNLQNLNLLGTGTPNAFFTDLVVTHEFSARGGITTPPTVAIGAGAGTGASVSIIDPTDANDMLINQIQLITGTAPAAATLLLTITMGLGYTETLGDGIWTFFPPNDGAVSRALGLYTPGNVSQGVAAATTIGVYAANTPAASTTYNFGALTLSK